MENLEKILDLAPSQVTQPVADLAFDLEVENKTPGARIIKVSGVLVESGEPLINEYVHHEGLILSDHKQSMGFTEERIRCGKSIDEVNTLLKDVLANKRVHCWNLEHDVQKLPVLKSARLLLCTMKRFSDRYGEYDDYWNSHRYVKLKDACSMINYQLEGGEVWHDSLTDARALAALVIHCNKADLSVRSIKGDVIRRSDHDRKMQQLNLVLEEKDMEINKLLSKIKNDVEVPF